MIPAMPASTDSPAPAPSLENAIAQLDAILAEMEDGKLPLEQLISRYEAGIKLVKVCQDQLQMAEKRIQVVARAANAVSYTHLTLPTKRIV